MKDVVELKRSLTLPLLVFYGLGNILGAGIYVLVGEVVAVSGLFAPVSFLVASLLATFTAFSYAELSARYPLSAGESIYVYEGFGREQLALLVGLLIIIAGLLSSSAIIQGFVGYLDVFVQLPRYLSILVIVLVLFALAAWGIAESVRTAVLLTVMEVVGLLLVLWSGHESLMTVPAKLPELIPDADAMTWYGIVWGGLLAFYAYIGFEDMVNVAEEAKEPRRNMPLAIILALSISALLYFFIALVAVVSMPVGELAGSDAPLAMIYQHNTGREPVVISLIGMFAVINGALIQIIMASRILYGLSRKGWLPAWVGAVNRRTQTPIRATAMVAAVILVLSLGFGIASLAENTSFVILLVFILINLALIRIKRRDPKPYRIRVYPMWLPVAGLLTSLGFVIFRLARMWV